MKVKFIPNAGAPPKPCVTVIAQIPIQQLGFVVPSISLAYGAPVTKGNLLYAESQTGFPVTASSVSDTMGNLWTKLFDFPMPSTHFPPGVGRSLWMAKAKATGPTTVTVNLSVASTAVLVIFEASGPTNLNVTPVESSGFTNAASFVAGPLVTPAKETVWMLASCDSGVLDVPGFTQAQAPYEFWFQDGVSPGAQSPTVDMFATFANQAFGWGMWALKC